MQYGPTTFQDVKQALNMLKNIERPDTDNHGDPLNGRSVYPYLSEADQISVNNALELLHEYLRDNANQPNRRSITTLNNNGFYTTFYIDPYNPYRCVGEVHIKDWKLDVSDPISL